MAKRGPKPKGKVKIEWSPDFAYAIGLLVTDGCVYKDGRHLDFTSKDLEQVSNFMQCFGLDIKISKKTNGRGVEAYRLQWSDVPFIRFLNSIGIYSAKSLTIKEIGVPEVYFFDFLRGCFDGDGSSYSYWDSRWKSSYMFYIEFISASPHLIHWIKQTLLRVSGIKGHVTRAYKRNICYQLKYSKHEAVKLYKRMYSDGCVCLTQKRLKIIESLAIMNK